MRFEDKSDVVIDPTNLKPSFGDLEQSLIRQQRRSSEPLVSVGDDNAQMVGGNARMVVECAGIGARHRRRGLAGEHDNVPVRSDCRPRETGDHVPYNANACKGVSEVCDD